MNCKKCIALILLSTFYILSAGNFSVAQTDQRKQQQLKEEQSNDSSILVSPAWLERKLKSDEDLVLIDLPFRKTTYKLGHIPGAVMLDWRTDIIDAEQINLYRLPQQADMEKLLSKIGVKNDSTIVLTDDMANRGSVRMYYTLKYFGHKKVHILNGGTPVWKSTKRTLTPDVPEIETSNYVIKSTQDGFFVQLEAVQKAIGDNDSQLIDGRPNVQFTGEKPGKVFHTNQAHKRLGHIPSAKNVPWQENLNKNGTFKSIDELRQLYESHGIDTGGDVVAYCNEGLHAAMPWFIFRELFGNEDIRLYDDSMAEWANRDDTPMNKGDGS